MQRCRLPQELICAIIDNVIFDSLTRPRKDYGDLHAHDTLRTCSLVCRSWLPLCQRRLFHSITFTIWFRCGTCTATLSPSARLDEVLLISPHLAGYIRELCLMDRPCHTCDKKWMAADETLPLVLRKLGNLQEIDIRPLRWSTLAVELRQSICWVLQLPSITKLAIGSGRFRSFNDFLNFVSHPRDLTSLVLTEFTWTDEEPLTPEETGDGGMLTWNKWGRLSELRLVSLISPNTVLVLVDWLLGPQSPADLSHVETLDIVPQGDAVNRLLRTIGSSLKHLELHVLPRCFSTLNFNINLEFNTALKFLELGTLDMSESFANSTDLTWLLRFLSNIDASNRLEEIRLEMEIRKDTFEQEDCLAWKPVDRILADAQFRFLQKLYFMISLAPEDDGVYSLDSEMSLDRLCDSLDRLGDFVSMSVVSAFPLLVERGVSVEADLHTYQ
ncbi:hypothetical protein JB92DRAFT_3146955 [Gautieria morchelliformis]|nr:hypothetical protein JB92DRAFT_3146955 [Gautieria morchelliformis]